MGKTFPDTLFAQPWRTPDGVVHQVGSQRAAFELMLRCPHPPEKRVVSRQDLGGLETDRYVPCEGCSGCGCWFMAGGPPVLSGGPP